VSSLVSEQQLAEELSAAQAVEVAYPGELQEAADALQRGLPVLVECDKGLAGYFYACLRNRLKKQGLHCNLIDGRAAPDTQAPQGMIAIMIAQLRDAVRGGTHGFDGGRHVMVLPHLDLLTSSSSNLTAEAREVIPLLYENPQVLWLGFRDPSFPVPAVICNLFQRRISIVGVPRDRLQHLVTRRESRKLGRDGLDLYRLYTYVSGLHAARLRGLLAALEGEDYPADAQPVLDQIRAGTVGAGLSVPRLDLDADIGGYDRVKQTIRREILDVIHHKEQLDDPAEIERVESLIPRGIIFWGPPGTGKTLFAKAIAASLGAAVQVVSGPELKSRWVGESEENLRRIFVHARQSAPSLIVFDELDSFASARGTYTGSGVEHSMVNQLLTELDGFRSNEMVLVVGTTNLVESLDPALLRPGRFEFQLQIPYPDANDRRAILEIYDSRHRLDMTPEAIDHAVRQSAYPVPGGTGAWSGDHLQALCRTIARRRLRQQRDDATTIHDVDTALTESSERPRLTSAEELVVATHEAGHAVVALGCQHVPPVERISIRGDLAGALGFVSYADPVNRYVVTRNQILDGICVLFGGREAESLLLDDLSVGSSHDLEQATSMVRALVERFGMGPDDLEVRHFGDEETGTSRLSERNRSRLERAVAAELERQRLRAREILERDRDAVVALRQLLLEQKVIDSRAFKRVLPGAEPATNQEGAEHG
jgi:cell division protease FtsH